MHHRATGFGSNTEVTRGRKHGGLKAPAVRETVILGPVLLLVLTSISLIITNALLAAATN